MDARDITLTILLDMETNQTFSSVAIAKALRQNQFEDKTARAFITRLAEGTTESRITLDYIIDKFSKIRVQKCKPLIRCLLRMGTYQIMYMDRVPDSAACNETVKLAGKHGFSNLSGFVNGVLRNIARHKAQIEFPSREKDYVGYLSVHYSVPVWLAEKLLSDYPKQAETILDGTRQEADTTIRVNTNKITRAELSDMLSSAGISVADGYYNEKALHISGYDFIRSVPGYKQGYFTVQDESSMCAVLAAGIKPGDRVLDVCAAPGGKTTAAAELLQGKGHVYSMDIAEDKLALIEENVERLGFQNVTISAHDATEILTEGDSGEDIVQADVVIADMPCSGLGVMGRKNDIKYRVTKEQMDELIQLQRRIFGVVYRYVRPGGTLLYSTCTINPDENKGNVEWFLQHYDMFTLKKERLFLQGVDRCDGFYFAVLKRS